MHFTELIIKLWSDNLHHFPSVCRKQQMNSVILQITLFLQVWTDELTNLSGSVCIKESFNPQYNKFKHCTWIKSLKTQQAVSLPCVKLEINYVFFYFLFCCLGRQLAYLYVLLISQAVYQCFIKHINAAKTAGSFTITLLFQSLPR